MVAVGGGGRRCSTARRAGGGGRGWAPRRPTACRASLREEEGRRAAVADAVSKLPLALGAGGFVGLLANRVAAGVAPVTSASSAYSRADVVGLALAATLALTGLQWVAVRQRVLAPVPPAGEEVDVFSRGGPGGPAFEAEVRWAWRALRAASRCTSLVVFVDGARVAHLGFAAPGGAEAEGDRAPRMGPICRKALDTGNGNYLANLALFPGSVEFTEYLPANTQALVVQPLGARGVLVAAADTQRGFNRVDQSWLSLLADKLSATLDAGAPE